MEIEPYLKIIWRRKWVILLTVVLTTGVVLLGTQYYSPSYEATTTLRVATSRTGEVDYEDLLYADRLLRTIAQIATGSTVKEDVARLYNLTNEPDIQVQVLPNTELMRITVAYSNPFLARDIANTVASITIQRSEELDSRLNIISIIDPAVTPRAPTLSRVIIIVLGGFVGLVGGFGMAFLFEYLDKRLYTDKQIEAVSELALLGKIPRVKNHQSVLTSECPQFYKDAFQILRTNLIMQNHNNSMKTLLITSADPGDGKSTIVANLAYTLSQMGKKVLVVDGDLRKPKIHKLFDLPNDLGFGNYLDDEENHTDISWQEKNGVALIPSGSLHLDPTLLLSKERISILIEDLENSFDFILIDTPSILAVPDANLLAKHADGLLLVVNRATTTKDKLEEVNHKIAEMPARMLGMVINKAELNQGYYYYQY